MLQNTKYLNDSINLRNTVYKKQYFQYILSLFSFSFFCKRDTIAVSCIDTCFYLSFIYIQLAPYLCGPFWETVYLCRPRKVVVQSNIPGRLPFKQVLFEFHLIQFPVKDVGWVRIGEMNRSFSIGFLCVKEVYCFMKFMIVWFRKQSTRL